MLDVKTGSGAFMKSEEDSVQLAELMVETGERMGKKVVALITDMDQPLGRVAGHSHEVDRVHRRVERQRAGGFARAERGTVCLDVLSGRASTISVDEGRELARNLIASGEGAGKVSGRELRCRVATRG